MSNQEDPILFLLCKRTLVKILLPDEQAELSNWLIQYWDQLFSFEVQPAYLAELEAFEQDTEASWERFKVKYHHELFPEGKARIPVLARAHTRVFKIALSAAAVLLIGFLLVPYLFRQFKPGRTPVKQVAIQEVPIVTDSFKAVLTLADNSAIALHSAQTGIIALQGGATINKPSNGLLQYENGNTPIDTTLLPNTLATPKGGRYQLTLGDGTKVTLNDTSVLRYPSAFTGPERVVELSGEAYFEVAKDTERPFKVKLKHGSEVLVLGTHFNINAYDDEPGATTTLLEGKIKITTAGKKSLVLKPGQQASIDKNEKLALANKPNINQAIAWETGSFDFEDQEFNAVMRQLARWYNVEVVYRQPIPNKRLYGSIRRNEPITKILSAIQNIMSFQYKIEDGKLILWN